MNDYVKLKDGFEYRIDKFGTGLEAKSPNEDFWYSQCSGHLKILDIRPESNTNVKCLLEDNKWYHIGSNGWLVPTLEQMEKDRQAKNAQKEAKRAGSDNKDNSSSLGVGAVIAGAGAMIGSAKKAIKDFQAIDDMSQLEEASNKVFDDMQNQWAHYNNPAEETDPSWFTDNDPWEKQERKRQAELSSYNKEIVKALKKYQSSPKIYDVLVLMVGFDSKMLKTVCSKLKDNPAQTDDEFNLWAQIIVGIQQGQVTTQADFDDCMMQMEQLLNAEKGKTEKKKIGKKVINDEKKEDKNTIETPIDKKKKKTISDSDVTSSNIDNDDKYDDLRCLGFKKEKIDEDLLKPKNAFDLITKGKNKKITHYKDKWNNSMWKRDHELKKKIRTEIVRIEEESLKLISWDDKLNSLIKEGKSTGFWGFGGSKEVNNVKSKMKPIKERISDHKDKLSDLIDELESCESDIKEYSDELYELTGLEKYSSFEPLDGKGISIARQLVKSKIDPNNFKAIFGA